MKTDTTCAWIGAGQAHNPLACTCTQPTVPGRSYCADHIWSVYKQGSAQGRRRRDQRVYDSVRLWESLFNEAVEELIEEGEL